MMTQEGYHWLPKKLQVERDEKIVVLYDSGVLPKYIAERMGMSYEGARRVLRKAGRMGGA